VAFVIWGEVRSHWRDVRDSESNIERYGMTLAHDAQERERDRQIQRHAIDSWRFTSEQEARSGRDVAKQLGIWTAKVDMWIGRIESLEKAIRQSLPLKVLTEFMPKLLSGPVDVAPMPREVVSVGAAVGGECIPPRADTSGPPRPGAGRP
jgi:hypothetical protein